MRICDQETTFGKLSWTKKIEKMNKNMQCSLGLDSSNNGVLQFKEDKKYRHSYCAGTSYKKLHYA